MNQELILSQIIEPCDNSHRNQLLQEVLSFQEKGITLSPSIIKYLQNIKTKDTLQIALIGLILWNEKELTPHSWKKYFLELKVEHFWDLENLDISIQKKLSKIPFDLLTRVFWGLLEHDIPHVHFQSQLLFKNINLITFTDIIILRKHSIVKNELAYFYSDRLSLLSEKVIHTIQAEL